MAKESMKAREVKRAKLVAKYAEKKKQLNTTGKNQKLSNPVTKKDKKSSAREKSKTLKVNRTSAKTRKITVFWLIMLVAFTISLTIIGFLILTSMRPY